MVVPIAALDAWISLYQAICFRVYGIARVSRSRYVVVDRQHLAYLNAIEKLNCMFCGYVNGVFATYVRSRAGPNNIGVRFGMRSAFVPRTSIIVTSSTTAMRKGIGGDSFPCATNCRTSSPAQQSIVNGHHLDESRQDKGR